MHNFMSYERRWLDAPHGGDHLGRTAWALGEVRGGRAGLGAARAEPDPAARDAAGARRAAVAAHDGLRRARPRPRRPRGAGRRRDRRPPLARRSARRPAARPTRRRTGTGPRTPCATTTRGCPQALIAAGARLGDDDLVREGVRALRVVRGRGRHRRSTGCGWSAITAAAAASPGPARGDEQPLDAAALVEAQVEAFLATGEERCARRRGPRVRVVPGPQPARAVGLRLLHRRLPRRPRRVRRQRATRAPSRRSPTCRRCSRSTRPACRRRCPE